MCVLKEVCDIGNHSRYMFGHAALFERSEELKGCSGLGLLPGKLS